MGTVEWPNAVKLPPIGSLQTLAMHAIDSEEDGGEGMVVSGSKGMVRRLFASRMAFNLASHVAAALRRSPSPIEFHRTGCTSSGMKTWFLAPSLRPLVGTVSAVPCSHRLPFGGLGRTRSKMVSPVHVNVLPSTGFCKGFASTWGSPHHASSNRFKPGQACPEKTGLVVRYTLMFSSASGGGSSGTSAGLNSVVRGTR